MPTPLLKLRELGQSVWLDFIDREILPDGLKRYIERDGVTGVTSNPTIFEKAFQKNPTYRRDIAELLRRGLNAKEVYEALAIEDVQRGADLLRPVYDEMHGADGFVSLECAPTLAYDTAGTLEETRRLFARVDRPNVMIKIPATQEGLSAIEEALFDGININITLLFDRALYAAVVDAYMRALERRLAAGRSLNDVASVASFFVSRVDTETDKRIQMVLQQTNDETRRALLRDLPGRVGVANAQLAYELFQRLFTGARFRPLAAAGARVQRPLWASTGTKNPAYSDVLYVAELIGPDTVNTMPPATIDYFRDHGQVARTVDADYESAREVMARLERGNISLREVTNGLQRQGVQQFVDSFEAILRTIEEQRPERAREAPQPHAS